MLDIDYIKQIDEVLEVEGWDFHYKPGQSKLGGGYLDYHEARCSIFGLSMPHSVMYELYLVRVIEAINKADKMYMIRQNNGGIEIFNNVTDDIQDFYFDNDYGNVDECKEKAIIYIMDHIKEKV